MYPQDQIAVSKRELAKTTLREYLRILKWTMAQKAGTPLNVVSRSRSRSVQAAMKWAISECQVQGRVQDQPDHVKLCRKFVEAIGGEGAVAEIAKSLGQNAYPKRKGRVRRLQKLDADWPEKIMAAASNENQVERAAIAALSLTGCRPCEVQAIEIQKLAAGLGIRIWGAKCSDRSGQAWRILLYPFLGDAVFIAELADKDGVTSQPFRDVTAKRVARLLVKASARAYGDSRRVIASDFRNRVASIAKATGWTLENIAELLGHQSQTTQKFYGRAQLGRNRFGWIAPSKVRASQKTRPGPAKPFGNSESAVGRQRFEVP